MFVEKSLVIIDMPFLRNVKLKSSLLYVIYTHVFVYKKII